MSKSAALKNMDTIKHPSTANISRKRSSFVNDELPYFYSQDSDVIFQIDSSKNRNGSGSACSEGEVFDFDMISAAENFDFLFSDDDSDSDLQFARNPFGGIESRDAFFQDDEEFDEDIKSVGADKISSFINKKAFQNTEKLEFSDPTLETHKKSDLSVVENFMAVRPEMFLFNFDASDFTKGEQKNNDGEDANPWAEIEFSDTKKTEGQTEAEMQKGAVEGSESCSSDAAEKSNESESGQDTASENTKKKIPE